MVKTILHPFKTLNLSQKLELYNVDFNSGSFSIIKYLDEYLLNFRFINYKIINNEYVVNPINNSLMKYRDNFVSVNKFVKLDNNYNIIDENKLVVPYLLQFIVTKQIKKRVLGIEDMRIFNHNNQIKIIGSSQNEENLSIVSGEYDYSNNKLINMNFITPSFNNNNVEKNWVYFECDNQLQIIYKDATKIKMKDFMKIDVNSGDPNKKFSKNWKDFYEVEKTESIEKS
jgi:hypothetical protein